MTFRSTNVCGWKVDWLKSRYHIVRQRGKNIDRVPAWLWEVRRGNKPPKKWYFNFQGQFLSQKKFYIKKLNGIGFSHVWVSNSAILKQFEKFHKVTAALWLPSSSFATCPSNLAKSAGSLFHTDFSKFPSIFANLHFFPSTPTPARTWAKLQHRVSADRRSSSAWSSGCKGKWEEGEAGLFDWLSCCR